MKFLKLILDETARMGMQRRLLIAAALSGLCNALLPSIISDAIETAAKPSTNLFASYIIYATIYLVTWRYTFKLTDEIIEGTVFTLRTRFASKLRRAEWAALERIGSSEIHERVSKSLNAMSHDTERLANLLPYNFFLAFSAVYLADLSVSMFVPTAILTGIGIWALVRKRFQIIESIKRTNQRSLAFLETLTDLLSGSKEVKFSRRRGDEIEKAAARHAESLRKSTLETHRLNFDRSYLAHATRFIVICAVLFVLPQHLNLTSTTTQGYVTALLFIFVSLIYVLNTFPAVLRLNVTMDNIEELEQKLDAAASGLPPVGEDVDPWPERSQTMALHRAEFRYPQNDGEAFHLGPISLTMSRGEVVFFVGGNGSGKSTLLKVLVGLYLPSSGTLMLDGIPVEPQNIQAYREKISVVFSDYHLFKELYGVPDVDANVVQQLLRQMHLEHKVTLINRQFSTLALSTGQRKRLALLVALLEDRPIIAFDEWAADQDPEYRKYFYEELIPDLKSRGKLVLVVTHDDRFFHIADQIITMELGQLRAPSH